MQILGAATAGGLIGLVVTGAAFALSAATFLLSTAFLARLVIPSHAG